MNTIQKISLKFIQDQSLNSFKYVSQKKNVTSEWIKRQSNLPWLKLDLDIPHLDIQKEINHIQQYFVDHRKNNNEHINWKSFCIHGKSYDSTREDSYYNDDRSFKFTKEACQFMPNTVNFFKEFKDIEFNRIRVMQLKPKGLISVHRDYDLPGMLNPINIAITQPNNCNFVMEKFGIVPFKQGDAFMLNVANRHAVYNDSDEYRYHIIIHYKPCVTIDNLILKSYNQLYGNLHN